MHSMAAYMKGLRYVSREALACKNPIAACTYGLSSFHADGRVAMMRRKGLSQSHHTNIVPQSEALIFV